MSQFAHLRSCWSKNNNWKRSLVTYFLKRYHCRDISIHWTVLIFFVMYWGSFCPSLLQKRLDHPSPGTMCKCGKAVFCAVFAAGSLISAGRGERGLTPTVLFLTWSTGCFYSPDMWTRLEKMTFHRAPTYDSTQRHRTELSPPFINGSCQTTVISTFRHSILVECVIYAPGSLNVTPSGLLEMQYVVFK